MKKLSLVLVAAGLMSLAACNKPTPTENAAENTAAALDNTAETYDAAADQTSNEATSAAYANTADALHEAADNVVDAAKKVIVRPSGCDYRERTGVSLAGGALFFGLSR